MRRVAVTGLGLVGPHGREPEAMFDALMRGESAIATRTIGDVEASLTSPAAACTGFDAAAVFGRVRANQMDRFSQLALASALDAWTDAGLDGLDEAARELGGVFWGSGSGGALSVERGYQDLLRHHRPRVSPMTVVLAMNNAAASHIALALKLGGPCLTYSVACASSSVAIGEAMRRIRSGEARVAIAGGSDALLSFGVMSAWQSLQVLAPVDPERVDAACRPFSTDRAGLVLGEGAAALVLEDLEHALERGAPIYAELVGYGTSCDHTHTTRPDAAGQVRAIRACLRDGGIPVDAVGYVNAHGTATLEGDPTEIQALVEVFGACAPELAVSATKSMHGHLMGAAGAIEALVTVLAVERLEIPPTAHLEQIDASCAGVRHIRHRGVSAPGLGVALSSSFAFGGSNAVLAMRRIEDK
jgi:3-oxoacyl-[acyl-carrier-protein] synthase II